MGTLGPTGFFLPPFPPIPHHPHRLKLNYFTPAHPTHIIRGSSHTTLQQVFTAFNFLQMLWGTGTGIHHIFFRPSWGFLTPWQYLTTKFINQQQSSPDSSVKAGDSKPANNSSKGKKWHILDPFICFLQHEQHQFRVLFFACLFLFFPFLNPL